jgi:DnaJ family protein C protein 28
MNFDIVVENKIKDAMEAGLFDNLAGMGKPLKLDENPHEPAAWRMAHQLIKDSGYTLPWIAERKDIEDLVEKALSRLMQDYRATHRSRTPDVWARAAWRQASEAFAETAAKLNKRIRDYNLQTPTLNFQRALIDVDKEIERVQREAVTGSMWKAAGG